VASKEIGVEVNADKTKYMVMSRDQNVGRSHDINIDNSSFERVGQIRYLGKKPNLSSSLLSKNINPKTYRTTVFLLFCKGVKLGQNKKDHPAPTVCALSKLLHL
jgi:hypothetical protein